MFPFCLVRAADFVKTEVLTNCLDCCHIIVHVFPRNFLTKWCSEEVSLGENAPSPPHLQNQYSFPDKSFGPCMIGGVGLPGFRGLHGHHRKMFHYLVSDVVGL